MLWHCNAGKIDNWLTSTPPSYQNHQDHSPCIPSHEPSMLCLQKGLYLSGLLDYNPSPYQHLNNLWWHSMSTMFEFQYQPDFFQTRILPHGDKMSIRNNHSSKSEQPLTQISGNQFLFIPFFHKSVILCRFNIQSMNLKFLFSRLPHRLSLCAYLHIHHHQIKQRQCKTKTLWNATFRLVDCSVHYAKEGDNQCCDTDLSHYRR